MELAKYFSNNYFFYPTVFILLYLFLDIVEKGIAILWDYPTLYYIGFYGLLGYWILSWYFRDPNNQRKRKLKNPAFILQLNDTIPARIQRDDGKTIQILRIYVIYGIEIRVNEIELRSLVTRSYRVVGDIRSSVL